MSEILTKLIVDALTGEVKELELSAEELAELSELSSKEELERANQKAKENARSSALAKLLALGLTEEEIAAL
jgi:DNA-binding NarL/FixJ family response regulator